MPELVCRVEVAWAGTPFDDPDSLTWTDISADVLAVSGTRGRGSESGQCSPGTCSVDVLDIAGDYDPANTAGGNYPNVTLGRQVRVRFSDWRDRVDTDRPAAHWRLHETSGTTAADRAGGYDGTYVNTPTFGTPGPLQLETSRYVGFASASSERVDRAYTAALNPAAVTVEAWVYRSAAGAVHSIITSLTANRGYRLRVNASNVVEWSVGNAASTSTVTGATTIPAATWTHILATSTASAQAVYVNGVLDGTGTLTYAAATSGTLQLAADNSTNYLNGRLADVAVYGSALPARAAADRHAMGAGLACLFTGSVRDWRQNYQAGTGGAVVTIDCTDLMEPLQRVPAPLDHEAVVRRLAPTRWFRFTEVQGGQIVDDGAAASQQRAAAPVESQMQTDSDLGSHIRLGSAQYEPLRIGGMAVGTADWTLSVWARSDTDIYTRRANLTTRAQWPGGSGTTVHLAHWDHWVQAGTVSRYVTAAAGRWVASTRWIHYGVTRETTGGNEVVTLYLNGVQAATQSWATPATNVTGATVAASGFVNSYAVDAQIVIGALRLAHWAFWSGTVLTAGDMDRLWQSGPPHWQAQRPEDRITTALTVAGSQAATVLDRGTSLCAQTQGGTALSACQDAAEADEGVFFVDGRGRPTFAGRTSRRRLGTVPPYAFGDTVAAGSSEVPYTSVTINNDDQKLWNTAEVNGRRWQDTAAVATYGERSPGSSSRSVLTGRDGQARAEGIVAAHKDPAPRIEQIAWQLPQTRGGALVLQLDPGDWIRVVRRPRAGQTITQDVHVEQVQWRIDTGGGSGNAGVAQVQAVLSATDPAQNTALTLGTSTFAGTDPLAW